MARPVSEELILQRPPSADKLVWIVQNFYFSIGSTREEVKQSRDVNFSVVFAVNDVFIVVPVQLAYLKADDVFEVLQKVFLGTEHRLF